MILDDFTKALRQVYPDLEVADARKDGFNQMLISNGDELKTAVVVVCCPKHAAAGLLQFWTFDMTKPPDRPEGMFPAVECVKRIGAFYGLTTKQS